MKSSIEVRPVDKSDERQWRKLWTGYLEFYEASVSEAVYTSTFERLLSDDPWAPSGFIAAIDDRAVGIVHFLYHAHCWRLERVCYLQDLFADPTVRGHGVGRKLIEAVYSQAAKDGAPSVYWLTQDHNYEARKLYDRIATLTPFIKYQN
ncbi:MAG: GNAT family N-acetyltransferase [Verrucomicrobia bacterium]|jgi:GNAT superfamily N-acetyltransferase|nr:GNAT family N-acetyltransferase [Verrucomicrobiota bacterium]